MVKPRNGGWRVLTAGSVFALSAAALITVISLVLPPLISRNYDQRSLSSLMRHSREIREEFAGLLSDFDIRKQQYHHSPAPDEPEALFGFFKDSGLDQETEGVALADGDGNLELWYGRVLELRELVSPRALKIRMDENAAFLLRNKSSVFLIHLQDIPGSRYLLAHFKLLAFIPQFQSSYIFESHALGPDIKTAFSVDYFDFREDVSGYDNLFARHPDGFVGQSQRENDIQTLFFPLRNEAGQILATVTLLSSSLTSKLNNLRENLALVIGLLLVAACLLALVSLWTSSHFLRERKIIPGLLILFLCASLRLVFFPLGRLEKVQSMTSFSPSVSGFSSLGGLTRSPADIFLTCLVFFTACACLAIYGKTLFQAGQRRRRVFLALISSLITGGLGAGGMLVIGKFIGKMTFNTNLSLLRWSLNGNFLLLHLSLLLFTLAVIVLLILCFRLAALTGRGKSDSLIRIMAAAGCLFLFKGESLSTVFVLLSLLIIAGISFVVSSPEWLKRRETAFLGLLLISLLLARTLDGQTSLRTRRLLETNLRHTILSQKVWGNFLIEQSFLDFDRQQNDLISFFKNPVDPDFAHLLWEKSPVAKFNWYSSLEVRDGEGNILSRFSLNVPKFMRTPPELEPSSSWIVVRRALAFIGEEKDFLIGYKDWYEEEHYLGRLVLYVSLDPETLPFLYSANPYFEALRINPLPSLNQFDFGYAVYDSSGKPFFNPGNITTAVSPADLEQARISGDVGWSRFQEGKTEYAAFLFRDEDKLFRLYTPLKELKTQAVEFLRIFLFDFGIIIAVLAVFALAAGRARLREPFRSFSNRVYAAFLASALIPLLLFTIFTRNLFDRIFTERFVEDAAIHASFARSLLEEFLIIEGMAVSPYLAPSEDLVLLISSTLENDVNLYSDAVHLASSRREFFEGGLLPDLLDGETYFNLIYGKKPYDTQQTKIGDYSFQTLTVPYPFEHRTLFISLPFPFEKEETAQATEEIVEFLVLLSSFFFLLVFLFSRGVRTMVIVPIRKLLAGTREVSLGNLEVSIEHRSRDEMMTLIDGFNTMIKDLKTREQELAEMSKKVAWTEMARKVAHEIKNPLTPIQLSAEHALKVFEDKKGNFEKTLRESMSYIISEVENLRRIAQDFMEISRDTSLRKDPLDIRDVLKETLEPFRNLLSERLRFKIGFEGENFRMKGDAGKLKTAFRNIITNAVEAIGGEGEIRVEARSRKGQLRVSILDNGPGIKKETLEHVFDPYFSTKESGTGLGLAISKKIVEDHDGTIQIASEDGKGTTVTFVFPGHD